MRTDLDDAKLSLELGALSAREARLLIEDAVASRQIALTDCIKQSEFYREETFRWKEALRVTEDERNRAQVEAGDLRARLAAIFELMKPIQRFIDSQL